MRRPARSRLPPWVESLIQSYGGEEEGVCGGQLKAHVIGVGQMTQSQALGSEGPTGLLFLSDGLVQIPAVLTAQAWEHLQEHEDRESFASLLNTTVCIRRYRLRFHMAREQTRCRFFLLVGELAATAAGPAKDATPCCTTLPSVQLMILRTWRALLGREDSQPSQCGYDLTELLGEWQHDCLQAVLEDVRGRLAAAAAAAGSRPASQTDAPTGWDLDRNLRKGLRSFSIPVKCLLIPEEDAGAGGGAPEDAALDLENVCGRSDATQPSVDDADWRIADPGFVETEHGGGGSGSEGSPPPVEEDGPLLPDMAEMTDGDLRPLSNPWDIFPPPGDTSPSSDASHAASPDAAGAPQPPAANWESQHSRDEQSYLPPYQKLPPSAATAAAAAAACSSSSLPVTEPSAATGDSEEEETADMTRIREKRRRREATPAEEEEEEEEEEEVQTSRSPPSWLFDSQSGAEAGGAEAGAGHLSRAERREVARVHADGAAFRYCYQVTGQNLADLSRLTLPEHLLHWAVRRLVVPKENA